MVRHDKLESDVRRGRGLAKMKRLHCFLSLSGSFAPLQWDSVWAFFSFFLFFLNVQKVLRPGWKLQAAFGFHVFKSHYLELQWVSLASLLLENTMAVHKGFSVHLLQLTRPILVQQHVKSSFGGRTGLCLVESIEPYSQKVPALSVKSPRN